MSARRSSRSIRVAPIAGSDRSRSIATTVVGLTSRRGTRAAIQFRLSPISAVSPRARQLGCSRECSASKSGVAVVDDGCDPFAPLTAAELAIGTTPQSKDDGAGGVGSPLPDDAPPLPNKHSSLGQPTARWTYCDAEGAALFHLWRFEPPGARKEFRPLTLGRDAKGLRWRWKAGPAPRPLYGLERLAARPDAPVIVCEGEKSADAARQIFPHCVVVTSTGGSQAALKADWMPLAGREVITWPDNDEPGSKYAAEVAAILTKLGCGVSIIDAAALVAIDPGGVTRNDPKWTPVGWDAAEALAEWKNMEALREAAFSLAKPFAKPSPDIEAEIAHLAKLKPLDYDRVREKAANDLGVRKSTLDAEVNARREQALANGPMDEPHPLLHMPSWFDARSWFERLDADDRPPSVSPEHWAEARANLGRREEAHQRQRGRRASEAELAQRRRMGAMEARPSRQRRRRLGLRRRHRGNERRPEP